MNQLPPNLVNQLTSRMSRQNLARFAVASRASRAATQRARTKRSQHMGVFRVATKIASRRGRRTLTPRTQMMVEVSRLLAKFPKTHRTPSGSVYHPRQRLHRFLFDGSRLKPGVERRGFLNAIQFGNVPNGRHWFYHNRIGGGQFRNGQWVTLIYPGFRAPLIVKENTPRR